MESPGRNTGVGTFPSPGDLPDPGIKPISSGSPALQADSLPSEQPGAIKYNIITWEFTGSPVVQFSSVATSCPTLRPHGLQHARPPCPSPTPRVYSNSCPLSQ